MKSLSSLAPLALPLFALAAACGGDAEPIKDPSTAQTNPTPQDTRPVATTSNPPAEVAPPATPPVASSGPAPMPPPAPEKMGDDQVLGALHVANQGEVEQGKLAKSKAKNANVKRFAEMMVKHHSEADAKATSISKKLTLQLATTQASSDLANAVKEKTTAMAGQLGVDFDKAYIDAQVKEHEAVVDLIDKRLAPSAQAPEVKAYVDAVRSKVVQHLADAKELQAKL